jgi:hypothetical protein
MFVPALFTQPRTHLASQITAAPTSSKPSTSQTPLKTLSTTLDGGNAGSDGTVTAPDPGSTGAKSESTCQVNARWERTLMELIVCADQGPGDNYISGAVRVGGASMALVIAVSVAVVGGSFLS